MTEREKFLKWLGQQPEAGFAAGVTARLNNMFLQGGEWPPSQGIVKAWYDRWILEGKPEKYITPVPQPPTGTVPWQFQPEQVTAREKGVAPSIQAPQVQSFGGYDYELTTGTDGVQRWVMVGPSQQQGLTDWQKAQIEQQNIARQSDIQQNAMLQAAAQSQERASQYMGIFAPTQQQREQDVQKAMAARWQNTQQQILSGLNSPVDWLNKWTVQQQTNPYAQDFSQNINERQKDLEQSYKDAKSAADVVRSNADSPNNPLTWEAIHNRQTGDFETQMARAVLDNEAEIKNRLNAIKIAKVNGTLSPTQQNYLAGIAATPESIAETEYYAKPRPTGFGNFAIGAPGGPPTLPKPTGPSTPAWLTPFSGQAAGTPMTPKGTVTSISGQGWNRLLPSQRQGLQGYVEYLGQDWEDYLAQSQAGLTKSLKLGKTFRV